MISKVSMVTIPVVDQSKALQFYTEKLGFTVITDAPFGNGLRWIELEIPHSDTKIALFTPPGHESRIGTLSNIIFSCKDIKATYKELKGKGVVFTEEPKEQSWGGWTAMFKDVDGNIFCLSMD